MKKLDFLKIRHLKCEFLAMLTIVMICNPIKSQFIGSKIDSSAGYEEVRKGSTVEYSVASDAKAGDEFRWEVTGGKIITAGAVGDGTVASPSRIEFTPDLHTIEVTWSVDDSTSSYQAGKVMLQRKLVGRCTAPISQLSIRKWSMPTAGIDPGNFSYSICSGETVGGFILIHFTGASDFTYSYTIKSNGLKDETGKAINTEHHTLTKSSDTAQIQLPAILFNPSKAAAKYYTIELTAMNDNFIGDGEVVSTRKEFTITVYPAVGAGTIKSTKLNRR